MFADNLNYLLKAHRLNAMSLARAIGVPKSIVYEWTKGKREPSMDNLLKLADYFAVSLEYLTGRPEARDPAEEELIVLLRATKTISPADHDALLRSFKENLDTYLRSQGKGNDPHEPLS
jgi:transcriptional regulator with XRE-family HTH domain